MTCNVSGSRDKNELEVAFYQESYFSVASICCKERRRLGVIVLLPSMKLTKDLTRTKSNNYMCALLSLFFSFL